MTTKETAALLQILNAAYPTAYKTVDKEANLRLWSSMFKDDPAQMVADAVKVYIAADTSGFPPAVGAIKAEMVKMQMADEPTPAEAWGHIRRAISNGKYHAVEEYEKLTEEEKRVVGTASQLYEWALMDADTLDSVVASNIQRAYRGIIQQKEHQLAIPADVRERILELAEGPLKRLEKKP